MNASVGIALAQIKRDAHSRGERWTRQRDAIARSFFAGEGHLSAEELHRRVTATDGPDISTATVYRTLKLLVEMGYAHKRDFGRDSATFEPDLGRAHHDHLVCLRCGAVEEFVDQAIERAQEEVARERGFSLFYHQMTLYGICRRCRADSPAAKSPCQPKPPP